MRLAAHRLALDVPPGWDARIYRRTPVEAEETTHPVLHAGNFPLPPSTGDYGSGAVTQMRPDDVLVTLVEFDAASAQTPLFARDRVPRPRAADFHPAQLQRTLPGQSGAQWFFHVGDRAFCLYVVLGSHARRARLVPAVQHLLDQLRIG
jgi:hypothetical protein